MNPYCRLIPRLNGFEIEERFDYYLALVRKGIAGFILFGGEIDSVRARLRDLQDAAERPLIIASDLEQGLGQQIKGGTLFPPAMAIASAIKNSSKFIPSGTVRKHSGFQVRGSRLKLLRRTFKAIALEARHAGVNTILAPVLDINTNPDNPIIATRAFGEEPETVSFFGCELISILQQNGIAACGKHFPGHGDTEIDSHISLPVIRKNLSTLEQHELVPFKKAVDAGVRMIMLGHLSVPAVEPSGKPASVSDKVVSYLRSTMGFKGMVITDAMNMGALGGYGENEATLAALKAGVELVLHPSDPDRVASYLLQKNYSGSNAVYARLRSPSPSSPPLKGGEFKESPRPLGEQGVPGKSKISRGRGRVRERGISGSIDFERHRELSEQLARMAITIEADRELKIRKPFLVVLNDDGERDRRFFIDAFRERYPEARHVTVLPEQDIPWPAIPEGHDLIVTIFSQTRAWKGKTGEWLRKAILELGARAKILISFGNPYVLRNLPQATKIYAYWDAESAQKAVIEKLAKPQRH